jgi:hypothetical protein
MGAELLEEPTRKPRVQVDSVGTDRGGDPQTAGAAVRRVDDRPSLAKLAHELGRWRIRALCKCNNDQWDLAAIATRTRPWRRL